MVVFRIGAERLITLATSYNKQNATYRYDIENKSSHSPMVLGLSGSQIYPPPLNFQIILAKSIQRIAVFDILHIYVMPLFDSTEV
jgi:hypothetical protein